MRLEQLLLCVEIQPHCIIKVWDDTKEDYTARIKYTYDNAKNVIEQYGGYCVAFIYPENDGIAIEIKTE